jgi:DNA modification methylase
MKLKDLTPDTRNANKGTPRGQQMIEDSLRNYGAGRSILVDKNLRIIAGNKTAENAGSIGMDDVIIVQTDGRKLVAVQRMDLDLETDKAAKELAVADNRSGQVSLEWDGGVLQDLDIDLSKFWTEDELKAVFAEVVPAELLTDEDAVPEVPEEPKTKLGDLYILGNHRLLCGDSTAITDVERLMDGEKADMVFTDPPYGIAYSSDKFNGNRAGVTNKRNKAEVILGDAEDFDPSFLLQVFAGAKEIFVWGYQYYPEKLGRGGIIVWNKKQESEADCPHGDFELCWSKNERNKMCWLKWGGFNNKEKGEGRLHTTQKPVALAEWFFENWGKGLTHIVDLFGGSGTTLIACEKTGRHARLMELDPKYCDVIVQRFENATGKKAVLYGA